MRFDAEEQAKVSEGIKLAAEKDAQVATLAAQVLELTQKVEKMRAEADAVNRAGVANSSDEEEELKKSGSAQNAVLDGLTTTEWKTKADRLKKSHASLEKKIKQQMHDNEKLMDEKQILVSAVFRTHLCNMEQGMDTHVFLHVKLCSPLFRMANSLLRRPRCTS